MIGVFIAATPGTCSDCGRHTKTGDRVRFPAEDLTDTVRLCVNCAPVDLLELLAVDR